MNNINIVSNDDFLKSILYEDNHIIVINKKNSQLVQGDITGDICLADIVKAYIKIKYNKPGNVFLGVVHRIDRPVSGAVIFAKTSKSLARLNEMIKEGKINKKYVAIVYNNPPKKEDILVDFLLRNQKLNKSFVVSPDTANAKEAKLKYTHICSGKSFHFLEVELYTGRHHQIRCQLSNIGCPIVGDVKYGAKRPLPNNAIHLHAQSLNFIHPVSMKEINIIADFPENSIWGFYKSLNNR